MSEICLEGALNKSQMCLEELWKVSVWGQKKVWKGFGKGLEGVLNVSGSVLEGVWKGYGWGLTGV